MADLRCAGVGWPNGAVENAAVFALPSPDILMLATEGRYHLDAATAAGKRTLWRAVPRIGKRPAEIGWSPARAQAEVLNLTDEPQAPIIDFVAFNELDLNSERGDHEDDFSGLDARYALIGGFLGAMLPGLRQALPGARIHFPAFTPDHEALGYVNRWREVAQAHDVLDFHAYDTLAQIQTQYAAYRQAFPGQPLSLTEWHCRGDVAEERRVLAWLADTMATDPLFDAAYRFIWRWDNPSPWWDDSFNVEGNPEMVALFMDPPGGSPAEEPPVPAPITLPCGIDVSSWQPDTDWAAVAASGVQFAIVKATEGVAYTNPYFSGDWAAIKANGLVRGSYHYATPQSNGPQAEADYFVGAVNYWGGLAAGDFLALDLEAGNGDLGGWTLAFLERVEELVGFAPLLYTSPAFIAEHGLSNVPQLARFGLWLASWQDTLPAPPAPWGVLAIWQQTSKGSVPGIDGNVDVNYFNGPIERLALYGKPAPVTPPVTPDNPDMAAEIAALKAQRDGLIVALAEAADRGADAAWSTADRLRVEADALTAEGDRLRGLRQQFIGARPGSPG